MASFDVARLPTNIPPKSRLILQFLTSLREILRLNFPELNVLKSFPLLLLKPIFCLVARYLIKSMV